MFSSVFHSPTRCSTPSTPSLARSETYRTVRLNSSTSPRTVLEMDSTVSEILLARPTSGDSSRPIRSSSALACCVVRRKASAAGTSIATSTITAMHTSTFAIAVTTPSGPVERTTCFVTIVSGSAPAPAACTSHAATAIGSRKLNTMTMVRMPNVVSASGALFVQRQHAAYASSSEASPTTRSIGSVNTMPAPGTVKLPHTS